LLNTRLFVAYWPERNAERDGQHSEVDTYEFVKSVPWSRARVLGRAHISS
jgi:hypothetical protein